MKIEEQTYEYDRNRTWISDSIQKECYMIGHDILKTPLITVEPAYLLGHAASLSTSEDAVAADVLHARKTNSPSRTKVLETSTGTLLLRDFCPPSLVERLRVEKGLQAFTNVPEREHALLLDIASSSDCALTLAYTPAGEIVGQVTLAPADGWWEGVENLYEVAIEVSTRWRGRGVARQLLAFALELDALEEVILFAMGLSWYWDLEWLGISPRYYRELIAHLFAAQGFREYPTAEPDISMEPNNILLARMGKRVDQRVAAQFLRRLQSSSYAPGW